MTGKDRSKGAWIHSAGYQEWRTEGTASVRVEGTDEDPSDSNK